MVTAALVKGAPEKVAAVIRAALRAGVTVTLVAGHEADLGCPHVPPPADYTGLVPDGTYDDWRREALSMSPSYY